MLALKSLVLFSLLAAGSAKNIVLTNDDGWAVAQIRAQFSALESAGHNVVLSGPAQDNSGTGSLSFPPLPLLTTCEYDSCPAGSPAEGFNASNSRLNYVNSFPVDAARYGIQTLSPKFFGGAPDLVVSGPNVGYNTGIEVEFSGTVGAACEAAQSGIPALAISGTNTAEEAWTNLAGTPTSPSISAARDYAALTNKIVAALFAQAPASPSLLPTDVILNINYPALNATCTVDTVQFVLSRVYYALLPLDVDTCNNGGWLPDEATVVAAGCFASVSVVNAWLKTDVTASTQQDVLNRLGQLDLACLPQ